VQACRYECPFRPAVSSLKHCNPLHQSALSDTGNIPSSEPVNVSQGSLIYGQRRSSRLLHPHTRLRWALEFSKTSTARMFPEQSPWQICKLEMPETVRSPVPPPLSHAEIAVSWLKHGVGRDKNIVLVPQPTDSPRDPLNWPLWKRDLIFIIFAANSAVIYWWATMLTPGYGVLAQQFNIVYISF